MNKKEFNEKNFSVFGFKFNLKSTLIGAGLIILFLSILLLIDNFATKVSWYGVLMGSAFLVALFVVVQLAPNRDFKGDFAYDLLWWIFPFSIIGARLYFCIFNKVPIEDFIKIWEGGVAIYGGIIGGAIGVVICCLIKKANIIKACDIIVPALILGQAIGRWGNFINQEVYGFEVTNPAFQWFPFAVYITRGGLNEWHLATFFYESVLNFIGFIILVILCRKIKKTGVVTCSYLIYYGIVRFFLEGLRMDEFILTNNSGFAASKVVSVIAVVIGVVGLCYIMISTSIKNKKALVDGEKVNINEKVENEKVKKENSNEKNK